MEEKDKFRAYSFSFEATGVPAIDRILILLAEAERARHSTNYWPERSDGKTYVEAIQEAANSAAAAIKQARIQGIREGWRVHDALRPAVRPRWMVKPLYETEDEYLKSKGLI